VYGFYWLEVYGYKSAFYILAANWNPGVGQSKPFIAPNGRTVKALSDTSLVAADNLPVKTYRLRIPDKVFVVDPKSWTKNRGSLGGTRLRL
jgi:hypothetical protein